jgi:hypothetical protein
MVFLALYDIVFACQFVNKRLLGQPMLTADTTTLVESPCLSIKLEKLSNEAYRASKKNIKANGQPHQYQWPSLASKKKNEFNQVKSISFYNHHRFLEQLFSHLNC